MNSTFSVGGEIVGGSSLIGNGVFWGLPWTASLAASLAGEVAVVVSDDAVVAVVVVVVVVVDVLVADVEDGGGSVTSTEGGAKNLSSCPLTMAVPFSSQMCVGLSKS